MSNESINVAVVSLGCPKNLVDSEVMLARLAEAGCVVGAPMDDADVVLINTCAFLQAARDESLEVIAEAMEHKKAGRVGRVVVAGCFPSRDGDGLFARAGGVDAIVGVNDRDQIVAAVTGEGHFSAVASAPQRSTTDSGRFRLTPRHTAYLRIAEGCSQHCTFCTIPRIRGPFRSKEPEVVLREASELVADGAVELNIIAQETTGYGRDLDEPTDLADLLRLLDEQSGASWIRLLYTYPRRFTDELIEAIADCPRVVKYVDIPLQHISDNVLKRMGRRVGRSDIETLLGKLRRRIGDVTIRTTFIVGFPGETEQDFRELLDFVREFRFEAMGVFEFSPEQGTPAASMTDAPSAEVTTERAEKLMLAQQEIAFDANRRRVGQTMEVLVDGVDESGFCVGRHAGQAPEIDSRCILTEQRPTGAFLRCVVDDWDGYDIICRPLE
ncbi:MAG: 30S ribosomal protein S12 methylthiotransferase RimO [Phycisphaerae bacterium]